MVWRFRKTIPFPRIALDIDFSASARRSRKGVPRERLLCHFQPRLDSGKKPLLSSLRSSPTNMWTIIYVPPCTLIWVIKWRTLSVMIYHFFAHLVPLFFVQPQPQLKSQSEQKRWSCGNSIFHERRPLFGLLNILGFLFLCTHCSLRVLSKGQSTSWLCIKVSHANGIYWTLRVHYSI